MGLALVASALLLACGPSLAGGPPYGVRSGALPWNRPGYHGYNEPRPASPTPPPPRAPAPVRYTVTVTVLPQRLPAGDNPNVVVLMAHLPEGAQVWFDGMPTKQKGEVRYYESPSLQPGRKYSYTARVAWLEDGKWVSQTSKVPVAAGEIHCLYLTRPSAAEKGAAALAKLAPGDRELARQQGSCLVQTENRLGSMGTPFKVIVKGQPVLLCCQGCREKALADPDKTLGKVKELRDKNARTPAR